MAAFSYDKHHPFLVDSASSSLFLFPNTTTSPPNPSLATITNYHNSTSMSCFLEQSIHNNYNPCPSPHQHHPFSDQPDPTVDKSSSVNISTVSTSTTKVSTCSNNSSSSAATALHQKQLINPMDKRKNNFQEPHSKQKCKKQRKENASRRSGDEEKKKKKKNGEEMEKNEPPSGYIHVRARRGQATDSHSLAERVRREKISERMKLLQALVPGCDKVTGKALMLDEIINYVQSLQNQVEFLSMKIACVNPMLYDFGMDMDAIMGKPEAQNQRSSLGATTQQGDVQQQTHAQATNIFNTTTSGGYSVMDTSTLHQLQQVQMSNFMSQPQLLWDVDENRQKSINQSGFTTNLSCYHLMN